MLLSCVFFDKSVQNFDCHIKQLRIIVHLKPLQVLSRICLVIVFENRVYWIPWLFELKFLLLEIPRNCAKHILKPRNSFRGLRWWACKFRWFRALSLTLNLAWVVWYDCKTGVPLLVYFLRQRSQGSDRFAKLRFENAFAIAMSTSIASQFSNEAWALSLTSIAVAASLIFVGQKSTLQCAQTSSIWLTAQLELLHSLFNLRSWDRISGRRVFAKWAFLLVC